MDLFERLAEGSGEVVIARSEELLGLDQTGKTGDNDTDDAQHAGKKEKKWFTTESQSTQSLTVMREGEYGGNVNAFQYKTSANVLVCRAKEGMCDGVFINVGRVMTPETYNSRTPQREWMKILLTTARFLAFISLMKQTKIHRHDKWSDKGI